MRIGDWSSDLCSSDLITLEEGPLGDFIALLARNYPHLESNPLVKFGFALGGHVRRLKQYNPIGKAQKHVAHHYDLSGQLYDLFLDADRQYSCAYFRTGEETLEQAQADKKRHLAAKLLFDRPGLKLPDIGSGWGGLGLYLRSEARRVGEEGCSTGRSRGRREP